MTGPITRRSLVTAGAALLAGALPAPADAQFRRPAVRPDSSRVHLPSSTTAGARVCYSRSVVSSGEMIFIVHGVGQQVDGRCPPASRHTASITACLQRIAPGMAGTIPTAQLQECLVQRIPGAAVAGGLLGSSSRGSVGVLLTDLTGTFGGSPSCGGYVDPKLASGRIRIGPGLIRKATEPAEKAAVVGIQVKLLADRQRYLEQVGRQAQGSNGVDAQEGEAAQAMKESAAMATEEANEQLGIPDTGEKGRLESMWESIKEWFSSDDEDESSDGPGGFTAAPPDQPNSSRPSLDGQSCASVASFLNACVQAPQTAPCQLFFNRLRNPGCNPLVALTLDGTPCGQREYSPAELRAAVQRAQVKCWSLVRPMPDGGTSVCGLGLPDGASAFLAVPNPRGGACASTVALTTEDQCAPRVRSPDEVAGVLLPDRGPALLDMLLGLRGGLPPLGPGAAGPR